MIYLIKVKPRSVHARASLLRDFVLGASDGIVTTFAIIAGVVGASMSSRVVIILGFAKLFADAISMFAGVYLGAKTEIEFQKKEKDDHKDVYPFVQGFITFVSFIIVGFLPLLPFVFGMSNSFFVSMVLVAVVLFTVGSVRAKSVGKKAVTGGIEMLLVGGAASVAAYMVGFLLNKLVV